MALVVNSTSLSLLERLRQAEPDHADWQRFDDLYRPLIRAWLRRVPGLSDDIDDVVQESLLVVLRHLAQFEHRRDGAFRAWLRQITLNRVRSWLDARRRRPQLASQGDEPDSYLNRLADPESDLSREWDDEHDRHVFGRLLAIVRADFQAQTWKAFTRFALEARTSAEVADELGMSEEAVLKAKFRVLKRLREEAAGLLGDS
jgi:RNA polymerase sigma-70 factor (ECF subfamily)